MPFQLDRDTQLLENASWVRSMRELFAACVHARDAAGMTDLPLVFRTHPSARTTYPDLQRAALASHNVLFDSSPDLPAVLAQATCVITINSSVGLHAMLLGKPVIVLGEAHYGIEGLTLQARSHTALTSALRQVQHFHPNADLKHRYWHFLANEYAVPGDWQRATAEHARAVRDRLHSRVHNRVQVPHETPEHIPVPA